MKKSLIALIFLNLAAVAFPLGSDEIVILIISQPNKHHNQFGQHLRANLYNQSISISTNKLVNVHILHDIISHTGYWTFLHALPFITALGIIRPSAKWVVLCEDQSTIDLSILIDSLSREDHNKEQYFGYPICDQDATIIHHFAFFENPIWFQYPLLSSGVAFSAPLIERLAKRAQKVKPKTDFSIDASHELALFILENITGGHHTSRILTSSPRKFPVIPKGVENTKQKSNEATNDPWLPEHEGTYPGHSEEKMKFNQMHESNSNKLLMTSASSFLCAPWDTSKQCAIRPNKRKLQCNSAQVESVYFAIKTCRKFHKDRIPTIEMTWGSYAVHKTYFSDHADDNIPTVASGVPNTDTGHCSKTLSILKLVLNEIENIYHQRRLHTAIKWIVLVDDDTILSVAGVSEILGCYNSSDDIYLGERYGYRLHAKDGFNYITGGGGIAFSLPTARKIVKQCTCPTSSSPDDMILGSCLHRLGVEPIHSSRFHQNYNDKLKENALCMQNFEPLQFINRNDCQSNDTLCVLYGIASSNSITNFKNIIFRCPSSLPCCFKIGCF